MKVIFILLISFSTVIGQDTLIFKASYIPFPDTSLIFLPNDYDEYNSNLPLVILLHGWSGNYSQWSKTSDLEEKANEYNFIIACPDGFYNSWYVNNPFKPDVQFEQFFWSDFIPKILKEYRIDRKNIFISGLSMGGHGAITLFLKNPAFFKSAGSTSGILDLTAFPDRWEIKEGLGSFESNPGLWKRNSAVHLLQNLSGSDKQILFDCGTEDFAYPANERFKDECESLNIRHKFISGPGKHSHSYWKISINWHFLEFYKLSNK